MAAAASSTMEISRRHSSSSSMGSKLRVTGAPSHRALSVVSTGARSAERRDLLSTIGHLLWREGLSARAGVYPERSRGGPRSRRRESLRDARRGEAMPLRRMPTSLANLRQDGTVGQQARLYAGADDER